LHLLKIQRYLAVATSSLAFVNTLQRQKKASDRFSLHFTGLGISVLSKHFSTMSERMVELHRAALLAAGKGSKTGSGGPGGAFSLHQNGSGSAVLPKQTPREAAVSALQSEDAQMKRFLQRLQHQRDDSRPGEAAFGPTVPTALSRRMLQRQGAGYLDGAVAAVASASADLFLATVLQQAVACRDQRLKGTEVARQVARKRKRHQTQYREHIDDRRRRKEEREAIREEMNMAAIEAAEALNQKIPASLPKSDDGDGPDAPDNAGKPRKKKRAPDLMANGMKFKASDLSDEETSHDSIDDEEAYYQEYYKHDASGDLDSDDEGDDDDVMILRDLTRPLEAWHFHLDGKLSVCENIQNKSAQDFNDAKSLENESALDDDGPTDSLPLDGNPLGAAMENGGSDDDNDDSADASQLKQGSTPKRGASKSPDDKSRKPSSSPTPG
jgi:hypothetical protein